MKDKDKEVILVIFRKFKGEVIALFPLELGTNSPYTCSCYAHVGQHSSADPRIVNDGRLAAPAEYRGLARELRSVGYKLKIGKRVPRTAFEVRREKLNLINA